MIQSTFRKLNQLVTDPVLRHWVGGRLMGRWRQQITDRGLPPYLIGSALDDNAKPTLSVPKLPDQQPTSPIDLVLAGTKLRQQKTV